MKYIIYLISMAVLVVAGILSLKSVPNISYILLSGAGLVLLLIIIDFIISKKTATKGIVSPKILDTSVCIDGRVNDICRTGFLEGTLIVPKFVLHELQLVADSADHMKRNKGRRGMDVLNDLKKIEGIDVQIVDIDYSETRLVDQKLVLLGKELNAKVITNDYNLNKVAEIQGVKVLNINDLSNAIKPIFLPGEKVSVKIMKEGKEKEQGIAYLADGTMIVVDNAKKMVNQRLDVVVTNVLQTDAGRMIFAKYEPAGSFAKPQQNKNNNNNKSRGGYKPNKYRGKNRDNRSNDRNRPETKENK